MASGGGDLEAALFWQPTPACIQQWTAPAPAVDASTSGAPQAPSKIVAAVEAVMQRDRVPLLGGLLFCVHGVVHGAELASLVARWPELTLPMPTAPLLGVAAINNPHPPKGKDLADQLTLLEAEWFHAMRAHELLDNGWQLARREERARHVALLVDQFVSTAAWVETSVIVAHDLETPLQMLERLLYIRNYNSVMAVLTGLTSCSMKREMRKRVSAQRVLNERMAPALALMDPSNDFEAYRTRLRVLRGKCCIPCLPIHLRDVQGVNWSAELHGERAVRFGWGVGQMLVFQRWLGIYQRELGAPWRETRQSLLALPRRSDDELRDISFNRFKGELDADVEDQDDDLDEVFDDDSVRYARRRIVNPVYGASPQLLHASRAHDAARAYYALRERDATLHATLAVLFSATSLGSSRTPRGGGLLSARRVVAQQHPMYKPFLAECARRKLIASGGGGDDDAALAAFFSAHHCALKPAVHALTSYWRFYAARQYRRLAVGEVAAALQSWVLCPPLSSDSVDHNRRPIVTMRANLWVDGDATQPSLGDLRNTLMWIGQLVQSTAPAFIFVLDLQDWRRELNFAPDLYASVLQTLQHELSSRCELVLLLDAPPAFDAVWEPLVQSCCRPAFRRRIERCTRAELIDLYVDDYAVLGDLGGTHARVDMRAFIETMRRAEADWHYFVPTPAAPDMDLSPVVLDDAFDEELEESSSAASPARPLSAGGGSLSSSPSAAKTKRTLGSLFGFARKQ